MEIQMNYGLMVVDPKSKNILHFCGYEDPPTEFDKDFLREELRNDPSLDLTSKWNKVEILEAPEDIVNDYRALMEDHENGKL
jgi:hypothetical protein